MSDDWGLDQYKWAKEQEDLDTETQQVAGLSLQHGEGKGGSGGTEWISNARAFFSLAHLSLLRSSQLQCFADIVVRMQVSMHISSTKYSRMSFLSIDEGLSISWRKLKFIYMCVIKSTLSEVL